MCEILFRGKRIDNGEWVTGNYCKAELLNQEGYEYLIIEIPRSGNSYHIDPDTVGQYTGMTDKNGVKIYEGDIVLKRTYNGKKPIPVTFHYGMFHCGWGGGSSTATYPYTLDDKHIEVIGNIYDNPELMRGDENEKNC